MSKNINYKLLRCPVCKGESLSSFPDKLICDNCQSVTPVSNGKYLFEKFEEEKIVDSLDKLKYFFKKYHFIYSLLIKIISPVCPSNEVSKFIKKYISGKDVTAINFGSGNSNLSPDISNVDIFSYDNVNLTCDIKNIPFKNDTVDYIINVAVLEHISNPEIVVSEFNRILKKDGKVILNFPFIQGFHSSPHDYSRRTYEGMSVLFKDFLIERIDVAGGPTSGLLWILQEWLAIIFSFGSRTLHKYLYIFIMILTFPLKFLDLVLKYHPSAKNITSNFYIIATKK